MLHKSRFRRFLSIILLIAFLNLVTGCSYYFNVVNEPEVTTETIKKYTQEEKYLILHSGDNAYHLLNTDINDNTITAKTDPFLGYHANYVKLPDKKKHKFKKKTEPEVTNTVHVYIQDSNLIRQDSLVVVPINSIQKIDLYVYNKKASQISHILPTVLIPVLILAGVVILFVATFDGFLGGGLDLGGW